MTRFVDVAPVLAVSSVPAALEHYRRLGFDVAAYDGGYGYATRDGVRLHLARVEDLDPTVSLSAAYLYVDDADRLWRDWADAAVAGRLVEPVDTDYGMREGAHIDPDGNLLRFGSQLRRRPEPPAGQPNR